MAIDFQQRIFTAKSYFDRLKINQSKTWIELYERHTNNDLEYIDKLTMIHPHFVTTINLPNYVPLDNLLLQIRGARSFQSEKGKCQSKLLWGYDCPFDEPLCHCDHMFPYSLGGPTIGYNKLLLCRYHNLTKGIDIHIFPWEDRLNRLSWLDNQVEKLTFLYRNNLR